MAGVLDTVVESLVVKESIECLHGSRLRVGRAPHHHRHTRLQDSASAHRARLKRDIECAALESPGIECGGSLCDGNHFSVRCRIGQLLPLIVGAGHNPSGRNHNCPDRHFIL